MQPKREGDKVWLDGVEGFSSGVWASSMHGSMARILEVIGSPLTYDDLVCYGGFAFRTSIHAKLCPSAAVEDPLLRVLPVDQAGDRSRHV